MKIAIISALLFIVFCNSNISLADSLSGIAKKYDIQNSGSNEGKEYEVNKAIPDIFYDGKYKIILEETTIANLKNHFGGGIKKDDSKTWVCYNSKLEGITYWFISYTVMQYGNLSTIIISPLDKKAKCNTPLHAINLKANIQIPLLYSKKNKVFHAFDLIIDKNITSIIVTNIKEDANKYYKSNMLQYFFKKDKTIGVFISQVTTN